jgi:uncharacterized membrane protein
MTIPTLPGNEANPFRAPTARVADADASAGGGHLLAEPRRVPASAPAQWLSTGWSMFKDAPGPWVGMVVVYMLIVVGVSAIPVLGLFGTILGPILIAGLIVAAERQAQGDRPIVGQLFEGFKRNTGSLAMVGVLHACLSLVFALVAGVGVLGVVGAAMATGGDGALTGAATAGAVLVGLVLVLVLGPLAFSTMWAPALVILHDLPAVQALKVSITAGLRNWLVLVVFILWGFVLLIPLVLTFGLAGLVIGPVAMIAIWAGYRDIFVR